MKNIFRLVKGLLPLLGLLLSLSLSAQDIVVKGHVKDATGESVIGANILIKGTSIGTISGGRQFYTEGGYRKCAYRHLYRL